MTKTTSDMGEKFYKKHLLAFPSHQDSNARHKSGEGLLENRLRKENHWLRTCLNQCTR